MALPDPIPQLTVDSITYDFARTSFGASESLYQTANGLDRLKIGHTEKNRNRYTIRFDRKKVAPDPFDSAVNQEYSMASYLVIDAPRLGVTAEECQHHSELLTAFMAAGTPDYVLRVLRGEI